MKTIAITSLVTHQADFTQSDLEITRETLHIGYCILFSVQCVVSVRPALDPHGFGHNTVTRTLTTRTTGTGNCSLRRTSFTIYVNPGFDLGALSLWHRDSPFKFGLIVPTSRLLQVNGHAMMPVDCQSPKNKKTILTGTQFRSLKMFKSEARSNIT